MRSEQQSLRFKRRLPCHIAQQGRRDSGIVLNLSEEGLYVQTNLGVRRGSIVDVAVQPPNTHDPINLKARVVWRQVKNSHIYGSERSGVGLQIRSSRQEYTGLVREIGSDLAPGRSTPSTPSTPPPNTTASEPKVRSEQQHTSEALEDESRPGDQLVGPRYLVRLKHRSGPRSKTLTLQAATREAAVAQSLTNCGADWELLEVDPL